MRKTTLALFAMAALAAFSAAASDLATQAPGATPQDTLKKAELFAARQAWDGAIAAYREAIAASPDDPALRNRLGICYQHKGDAKAARKAYKKALDLRKDYAEAWNNIGTLEQARRRFKPAVRAYKKAIDTKPGLATPWKNLGNAYLALGRVQEAFEAYQEAFRLDPTILEAQGPGIPGAGIDVATQSFYLAKLFAANGQTDAAIDFLRRAKEAGFRDFARVRSDPDFRAVVADPRYKELVP